MSLTTIHIKGEESKVNIYGNEKEGFAITLIICYDGDILIPILTAKGKTKLCLKKYNLDDTKINGTYSNNGWVNNGLLKIALDQIYTKTKGKNSVLLLDQYPVHISDFIKEEAKKEKYQINICSKRIDI